MSIAFRNIVLGIVVCGAFGVCAACSPRIKEPASLIDHAAWRALEPSEDPFIDKMPQDASCLVEAHGQEQLGGEDSYGIDTQDCGYITLGQPALVEIDEGDVLHMRLWHFELTAREEATSTIVVALDGQTTFERSIPIPADSGLEVPYWKATQDAPAGTQIQFHLRNHGTNSYSLIELVRGGEIPPSDG